MFYIFLFISALVIFNSNAMEIIKSDEDQKKHDHPFFKKYLLTQEICQSNNIPQEINKYITLHRIDLRNNYLLDLLKDKNSTMIKWCNAHIPLNYYYLLNNTQIQLLQEIFRRCDSYCPMPYPKCRIRQTQNKMYEHHYFLQSEEDYQLFLTLPIELRKCLAQAPNQLINWSIDRQKRHPESLIPTVVNASQVVQVKSKSTEIKHTLLGLFNKSIIDADFCGYTPQLIVPEEKENINNQKKE